MMMRGAARGRSTTRRECTNAMQGAGSATPENVEEAQALVLGAQELVVGVVQVSIIMHFICQAHGGLLDAGVRDCLFTNTKQFCGRAF